MIARLARAPLTLPFILAVALLLPAAPAQAEGPGVVSGQVVNGTPGGRVGDAAQVALGIYRNNRLEREVRDQVDAAGRFRFAGLEVGGDRSYQLGTVHADAPYRSEPFRLTASQPTQRLVLRIYEPTPADPGLRATRVIVSLGVANDGAQDLVVSETVTLANPSDRAFAPAPGGQAGPMALVRFGLPPGAHSLQPRRGLDPGQILQVDRGFASLAPVPPGEHDFAYSYRVPFAGEREVLERSLPYGAEVFRVIVAEGGPTVAGPDLALDETRDAGGSKVLVWAARDLAPGTRLGVELSGLPARPLWARVADVLASPVVLAALLALVPALGVFWTLRGRVRRGPRPAGAPTPEGLVEALADLDEAAAGGLIPEPEYRKRRRKVKSELRDRLRSAAASGPAEALGG
jgi:hypothetical protein